MADPKRGCECHWREHVCGIEMPDDNAIANVRPRGLAHQSEIDAFIACETLFGGDHERCAVEQGNESNNCNVGRGHLSSLAAVTTLCATSLMRRFSFIAALRS